jgi:glycoprotein-N-acetylgalactosamine 3-beta-galactosyltransferase
VLTTDHELSLSALLLAGRQKCDGFFAASNRTDPAVGAVNIPHHGPEIYQNMWQKVRSIWSFIYDNYYDKYDWFHIGGDDMYVIVDNLRQYLDSDEIRAAANGGSRLPDGTETSQVPLYLGRQFAAGGDRADTYNTGGPGYTLNRAALKTLVALGMPKHFTDTVWSSEDIFVARILRQFNVYPYDTRDEDGGNRYMHFSPAQHYVVQREESQNITSTFNAWYRRVGGRDTPDRTAARSVAFHHLNADDLLRMHALLYGYCGADLPRASGEESSMKGNGTRDL